MTEMDELVTEKVGKSALEVDKGTVEKVETMMYVAAEMGETPGRLLRKV